MPYYSGDGTANTIYASNQADNIYARGGNDVVYGGDGADYIDGGQGHDQLYGDDGNDTILGGTGNDLLDGGSGDDVLNGGSGIDWAGFASGGAVVVNLAAGTATGQGNDQLLAIENVFGSVLGDSITGSSGSNVLDGNAGDDSFFASAGYDTIIGGSGVDTFYGQSGKAMQASLTQGTYYLGSSGGTLAGVENLVGANLDDTLIGDGGNNSLTGGLGNDALNGGAGLDILLADFGNDTLTGGADADSFVIGATNGARTITDFELGIDKIDLTAFGFDAAGNSSYWAGSVAASGANTVLTLAGQGGELATITLSNIDAQDLSLGDFVGGSPSLLPPPPPPPPPPPGGNGVADIFVVTPMTSGNQVINGYEDGLDKFDLSQVFELGNFDSVYWSGYMDQYGNDCVMQFWGQGNEYFTVTVTNTSLSVIDYGDFI